MNHECLLKQYSCVVITYVYCRWHKVETSNKIIKHIGISTDNAIGCSKMQDGKLSRQGSLHSINIKGTQQFQLRQLTGRTGPWIGEVPELKTKADKSFGGSFISPE